MKCNTKVSSTEQKVEIKTKVNAQGLRKVFRQGSPSLHPVIRARWKPGCGNQMLTSEFFMQTVGQGFLVFKNAGSSSYAKTNWSRMVNKRSRK